MNKRMASKNAAAKIAILSGKSKQNISIKKIESRIEGKRKASPPPPPPPRTHPPPFNLPDSFEVRQVKAQLILCHAEAAEKMLKLTSIVNLYALDSALFL